MAGQRKEYWHEYYKINKKALKRSAKTVYHARMGKKIFWIKPPVNYNDFCKKHELTPQLY
tara:strand:+ start:1134 stop:1313 length:180 start_codon:yes stop_codon:yes gene_type:complete